jgi:hypothetical protein
MFSVQDRIDSFHRRQVRPRMMLRNDVSYTEAVQHFCDGIQAHGIYPTRK